MTRTTPAARPSLVHATLAALKGLAQANLVAVLAWFLTTGSGALAETQRLVLQRFRETIDIDSQGNAKASLEMKFPASNYTNLKRNSPNLAALLREIHWTPDWNVLENVHGVYDDGESTIRIDFTVRGLARATHDGRWEAPLGEQFGLEEVAIHDNQAVYTAAITTELGSSNLTVLVNTPAGSHDLQTQTGPARLGFVPPPSTADHGQHPAVQFQIDTKPQVMTCLASAYANPKFTDMWLARVKFTNTGDQNVNDFRIRFRVADYSSWSDWQTVETVVPGQTVIEPYFPVFEVSKLLNLSGTRTAMIETEYQYRLSGPAPEAHRESRRTDLLGRNQVFFSNMKADDMLNFYEQLSNGPMILASFVTHEDPVIQQVGGWVSGQAGNGKVCAASARDEDALAFLKALYEFMVANKIAYQTPPTGTTNDQFGQHIKYGRDVLRNRAGTCIDLAIFYGSVCEAVGLEPVLYLIPGHCYPAVYLPQSHRLVAVESTMIGQATFEQAMERGQAEAQEAANGKPAYLVNIKHMHDQGIACLELPSVPADVLAAWKIHRTDELKRADAPTQVANNNRNQTVPNNTNNNSNNNRAKVATPNSVIGTWYHQGNYGNGSFKFVTVILANGTYGTSILATPNGGQATEIDELGYYKVNNNGTITFTAENGAVMTRSYQLKDGYLWVNVPELGGLLAFGHNP